MIASRDGLPGDHHFYVGFRTDASGVVLPPQLLAKYPEEMTIVLQHQFWGLEIGDEAFSVSLSFSGRVERLTIPFAAIVSFADPSVKFGLQFEPDAPMEPAKRPRDSPAIPAAAASAAGRPRPAAGRRNRNPRQVSQALGSASRGRIFGDPAAQVDRGASMSDSTYHELFPLGADDAPYRKLTGDHVSPAFRRAAHRQGDARGADFALGAGLCRQRASAAARPSGFAARDPRRSRSVVERQVRRLRPP